MQTKKGRFVVMLISELIFFASVTLCAFLPYLVALPVLRLVQGIGYAAVNTATAAAVADYHPQKPFWRRDRVLHLSNVLGNGTRTNIWFISDIRR
nr:hypothetical protein [uncultured Acetobacterium sp.]